MAVRDGECWIVSKYAVITWQAGRIQIASSASGVAFQTESADILRVLHSFAEARPIEAVVHALGIYRSDETLACIHELIASKILVNAAEKHNPEEPEWEPNALAFHRTSRNPKLPTDEIHRTPANITSESSHVIGLDGPSAPKSREFSAVLESRRSRRAWPKSTIARKTFSSLLWMSARNRDSTTEVGRSGYVNRSYPSGGSAYSLEVFPVIAPEVVESIPAGIYRYLPESHGLEIYSREAAVYLPLLASAGRSAGSHPPPILLIITSRFARQTERYGDLAYSLVLKEVGALFQTLYLVAEYLDLAACALGAGTADEVIARLCNTTPLAQPTVGEFMIGPL